MVTYFADVAVIAAAFVNPAPKKVWNVSAIVPSGVHATRLPDGVQRNELDAIRKPESVHSILSTGKSRRLIGNSKWELER
jgi:type IV secretory pathway protease TraF